MENDSCMRLRFASVLLTFALAPTIGIAQNCPNISKDFKKSIVHLKVEKVHKTTGAIDEVEGTGFIVHQNGMLITNYHVVSQEAGIDSVRVTGAIGSRNAFHVPVLVIKNDEQQDLSLLQMANSNEEYVPVLIGEPWSVSDGAKLCSLGFPLQSEFHYTDGPLGGKIAVKGWWSTAIPSNRGESGSPVFADSSEKVVAIKEGGYEDAQNLNLIIPINLAANLIIMLPGHGELPSASPPLPAQKISSASPSLFAGNATVYNGFRFYDQSTFSFGAQKVGAWGTPADLGVANPGGDNKFAAMFLDNDAPPYTDTSSIHHEIRNSGIKEMPTGNLDDVKQCPMSDYKVHYFQPELGGVYCVRTEDGRHWAKIKITLLTSDRIGFDYVYQPSGSTNF